MNDDIMTNIITEFVDKFICEIKKKKNHTYIKTYLIDPSISYCLDRLYPYIIITSIVLVLFFSMLVSLLFMSYRGK